MIVNPSAGSGRGKKRWPSIKQELERQQLDFECCISPDSQAIAHMVPELITRGARKFVAVGGDGTLHQLINAIFDQKAVPSTQFTVGIIPIGTGNDWIRSHGINGKLNEAVALIKSGHTKLQDIGLIKSSNFQRCFINMVGLGLTPFAVGQFDSWGRRLQLGSIGYLITTAVSLFKYRGGQYQLSNGTDFQFEGRLLALNIGLGQYCGGGIRLVPQARFEGQKLQFTLIHPMAIWNILANLNKLFNGKILLHPKVDAYEASVLTVGADEPFYLEADGELIPRANSFTFSMIPGAISILAPERKKA